MRNPEEVAAKITAAMEYSDVLFLRGSHLSCHLLRKAPRTCQTDFNYLNKNHCKGKMFWLTCSVAGFSGKLVCFGSPNDNDDDENKVDDKIVCM